jgi:iron complex outermembrane receptor protein
MKHSHLLATTAVVTTLAGIGLSTMAMAQTAPVETLPEVVVTSRRQAERLQDVPLAITALNSKALTQAGVTNLADVAALTPGILISRDSSEGNTSPLSGGGVIRGLADVSGAGNPTVGVFFNGVALPNAFSASVGMLDMERIEVVKGPQSALYGRAAFAGAINYVTKQPGDTLQGFATGVVGNGGERGVNGAVSGPIVPGLLSVGIAGGYDKFDGTYEDAVNGLKAGGHDKRDVRLSFMFTPTEKLKIFGGYYHGDDSFSVAPQIHATNNCGAYDATRPDPGTQFNYYCGQVTNSNPLEIGAAPSASGQTANQRQVQIADLHLTYDFGFATGSIIYGYQKTVQVGYQDFTTFRNGIAFAACTITAGGCIPNGKNVNLLELFGENDNNEDNSVEIRLASRQDRRIRWAAGVYYSTERSAASTLVGLDAAAFPAGQSTLQGLGPLFLTSNGQFSTSNLSLTTFTDQQTSPFASLEIDPIQNLTAFGEVRHTIQNKTFDIERSDTYTNIFQPFGPGGGHTFNFDNFRTGLRYKVSPSTTAYVSVASGEKAGGFNQRATVPADFTYQPETNLTYEGGLKTELFERRLMLDVAVFHIEDNGLQVTGPSSDPKNPGTITTNYGNSTSDGIEVDTQGVVNHMLTLTASGSYVDPKFGANAYDFAPANQDYISGLASCQVIPMCAARLTTVQTASGPRTVERLNGLQTPFTSKVSFNLGANLHGTIYNNIDWFGRVEYRYESKRYNTVDNINWVGDRNNVDLSVGVTRGPISAIAFVTNLTNDQTPLYTVANARLSDFGDVWVSNLPDARQYGIRLTYKYGG